MSGPQWSKGPFGEWTTAALPGVRIVRDAAGSFVAATATGPLGSHPTLLGAIGLVRDRVHACGFCGRAIPNEWRYCDEHCADSAEQAAREPVSP